ncbi:5,10-methylenetetrahydrofolate reductase [Kribbella sp.]|uniref:methylenetetrahydrofolate reductase n=1 Tax=Kribbella sp. TaxID=1871183 RepID=UPI002D486C64|nr:5,10-methylenetetrahydrofolate reductase [Kribbella sp.]HZX08938.1 5,10-methylenetetrahydrofolate reductase [Kribbella sp.]
MNRSDLSALLPGGRGTELLLYGMTPPRQSIAPDALERFTAVTRTRLEQLDIDALILYDIDDEAQRTPDERPFPFSPTMDPADFLADHLAWWDRPTIVYRSVGKYTEVELDSWVRRPAGQLGTVLVGAPTSSADVRTTLPTAYDLWQRCGSALPLGGVTIPERHSSRQDEHHRLLRKQRSGCSFFVTQIIYDVGAAMDLASDYLYLCREQDVEPVPIVFTLSICGSVKTLEFLAWLGVRVPRWLRNELVHSADPVADSYAHCVATARALSTYCRDRGLPFGFNIESVSTRRIENDAVIELVKELRTFVG